MKTFNTGTTFTTEFESISESEGVLKGVKMVSEGEAKGHGVLLNKEFIKDTVRLAQEQERGVKARFGHPNMCSTSLGTYLGVYKNVRLRKESVEEVEKFHAVGDLHLSESAKDTPNGNLYDYVLSLANERPDMFGSSIAFTGGEFEEENEEGEKVSFATIKKLHATDLVDTPAATDGLFDMNENDLSNEVTNFLDSNPKIFKLLSKKPEIIEEFMNKYNNYKTSNKSKMSRKKEPFKEVVFGDDVKAVYQGELKTGTELFSVGEEIQDGLYQADGQDYTIKGGTVEGVKPTPEKTYSVKEFETATIELNTKIEGFETKIEELTQLNETLTTEKTELSDKVAELEALKSGHKAPVKDGDENEKEFKGNYKDRITEVQNKVNKVN